MNKFILNNQFLLGSASPRRLELLKQIGINPDLVEAPNIDETNFKKELPLNYVKRMAIEKSLILQPKYENSTILTADTVVALGRRILPKTTDVKMAEDCLRMISGRRHKVLTSFALCSPNKILKVKTVVSLVKFKRLHNEEIKYYLETNEWNGKAGGYAIQGVAASFINFISGSYSNVMGLPLAELYRALLSIGYHFKNAR